MTLQPKAEGSSFLRRLCYSLSDKRRDDGERVSKKLPDNCVTSFMNNSIKSLSKVEDWVNVKVGWDVQMTQGNPYIANVSYN